MTNYLIKKWAACCLIGMTVGLAGCHSSQDMEDRVILPTPLTVEKTSGAFTFHAQTVIAVPGNESDKLL